MSDQEQLTISAKLENSFLHILRVVVLIVLSLSLVGSVIFAIVGIHHSMARASEYPLKAPNMQALLEEIKLVLEPPQKVDTLDTTSLSFVSKGALQQEIDKQIDLVNSFLQQFDRHLANQQDFRDGLIKRAEHLAFDPENQSSVLDYAKGQSALLNTVFSDQSIVEQAKTLDEAQFTELFGSIIAVYPEYYEKQKNEKKRHEARQGVESLVKKAGGTVYLYIAASMFVTFLLISLFLVLVKIERNLRSGLHELK